MKLNRFICGLTLVGVAGFYSCTSDENLMSDLSVNGKKVPLTITVNRGDVATRTELSENAEGGLDDRWLAKEVLQVYDASGKNVGELVQKDGYENSPTAVFSGTVTVADGNSGGNYCIWYFGQPVENENGTFSHPYITCKDRVATVNLGNQSFKSAKDLSKLDVMYQNVAITVSDGEAFVDADVTMTPVFAMARFSLTGIDGESGNLVIKDVSASSGNSNATAGGNVKYNLATGAHVASDNANALSISVDGVEDGEDVYVALFPKAYTLGFTFTGTSGYTAQITSKELEAGKYYCALPGEGETGLSGIKVEMTKTGGSEDDPYKEYANEDPRNPLHKFAKYNLVRVGDRGSLVNGFADSETENGALYQWGRNYGYMDTNGIYREEIVSPDEDFTNFIDALGRFDNVDAKYDRILDYYVYNPDSDKYFMTCGTAMRYTPDHPQYTLWYDAPRNYSNVDDIKNHLTNYFMDGTPGSRFCGYGNWGIGMEQKNEQPDYWLDSFGDGGKTWIERAAKCGYTTANPCPIGWRMPTLEEFQAIAPEGQGLDNNKNMASMLSNYSEIRKTTDGVNYVIRWLYDSSAITIEAVVTETALSKSDITSKFWDDNRYNKVVRKFPFTGSIVPLICLSDGLYMACEEYIVRPHHRGFLDYTGFPGGDGPSNNYYWMFIEPGNNGGAPFGGYWMDEKNYAFKFEAKEISHGSNTSNSSFTSTSCLFVGSAEPVMGYAIRPVMDK